MLVTFFRASCFFLSNSSLKCDNFHLHPCYTEEVVVGKIGQHFFTFIDFTSNQLLILSNLKDFFGSTDNLDNLITISHCDKSFFTRVEVDLQDLCILDDFSLGHLLCWVEGETLIALFVCSCSALLTIVEGEYKCFITIPLNLFNRHTSELFITLVD